MGTSLRMTTGTEGPHYDPYGYTEYTTKRNGRTVIYHGGGLIEWVKLNGVELKVKPENCYRVFEILSGMTLDEFCRYYNKIHSICPKCFNKKRFYYCDGFPGETFTMCSKCHSIVDCEFDRSAVE